MFVTFHAAILSRLAKTNIMPWNFNNVNNRSVDYGQLETLIEQNVDYGQMKRRWEKQKLTNYTASSSTPASVSKTPVMPGVFTQQINCVAWKVSVQYGNSFWLVPAIMTCAAWHGRSKRPIKTKQSQLPTNAAVFRILEAPSFHTMAVVYADTIMNAMNNRSDENDFTWRKA